MSILTLLFVYYFFVETQNFASLQNSTEFVLLLAIDTRSKQQP